MFTILVIFTCIVYYSLSPEGILIEEIGICALVLSMPILLEGHSGSPKMHHFFFLMLCDIQFLS